MKKDTDRLRDREHGRQSTKLHGINIQNLNNGYEIGCWKFPER